MNELLGLGYNHSTEEEVRIEQVTLEQVQDVASRYFEADNYAVAISTRLQQRTNPSLADTLPVICSGALWGRTGYRPVEYVSDCMPRMARFPRKTIGPKT